MNPRQAWAGAALTSGAVLAGVFGMSPLVVPDGWGARVVVLVLLSGAAAALVRSLSSSRTLPTVVALTVGTLITWAGFAPDGWATVPDANTLDHLAGLWAEGVRSVIEGRAPIEAGAGLGLMLTCATALVLVLADLVAWGLGRPGLAGVVLLAPWAAVAVFERQAPFLMLVLGGCCYLLTLTVSTSVQDSAAPPGTRAVLATVTVLVALLVAPMLALMPGAGVVALPSLWEGDAVDAPIRVSTQLDMRADLDARPDRPVMTYTSGEGDPYVLRLTTLTWYHEGRWHAGDTTTSLDAQDRLLWPEDPGEGTDDELDIHVLALTDQRVPLPVEPRRVSSSLRAQYLPEQDEVLAPISPGTRISMVVTHRDLAPEQLRTDVPGEQDHSLDLFGAGARLDQVAELAREVTSEATTAYDQALALQDHFRTSGGYRYSEQVPERQGTDPLWDFLTERTGYCVQYATAMTVMARTLDIPARVGVGFLPGVRQPDGSYVVRARDAHAWPELYFEDAGWVRFEPTPAVQTGSPPGYATDPDASVPQGAADEAPTGTAQDPAAADEAGTDEAPGADPETETGGSTEGGGEHRTVPLPLLATMAVVVLAGAAAAAAHRFRASRRRPGLDAEWARLRVRLARRGVLWPDAASPRAAREVADRSLGPDGRLAMAELVDHLEESSYRPPSSSTHTHSPDQVRRWVETVIGDVRSP